jgi:NADH:ubiquinone oxidoreductase subunit 6 (subunit J)
LVWFGVVWLGSGAPFLVVVLVVVVVAMVMVMVVKVMVLVVWMGGDDGER